MSHSMGTTVQIQQLLDLAAHGHDQAYDELIVKAAERLQKLTRKMLRNYPLLRRWEQTDDVFQDAVLRLHRSLSEVRPESVRQFFGLATTQIRRTLIDLARHYFGPEGHGANHLTDRSRMSSQKIDGALKNLLEKTERPETFEAWAEFHELVSDLPADEREVFQLVWYAGMPQKEVADLLGVSVPTIKRRWHRARIVMNRSLDGNQLFE